MRTAGLLREEIALLRLTADEVARLLRIPVETVFDVAKVVCQYTGKPAIDVVRDMFSRLDNALKCRQCGALVPAAAGLCPRCGTIVT